MLLLQKISKSHYIYPTTQKNKQQTIAATINYNNYTEFNSIYRMQ